LQVTRNRQKSSSASTRGNYQGINLSTWLAANPSYLLEANFPLKPDVTQKLPRRQQFVVPKEGPDA
jgi:oxalate decarboxylase